MAFEIPTIEPTELVVGDSLQWTKSLSDYPATSGGWTLTYYLRANLPSGQINLTATAVADIFAVDVLPAVTSTWTPGDYVWEAYVSKSAVRRKVGSGSLKILPDFSAIELPYDGRTLAKKTLDSIELVIAGRANTDIQRYVMQAVGRSIDKMPIKELLAFRDYYLGEVKKEEAAASGGKGKNIFIRFT